ncbi:MAG: potassium transporter TrkG [Oscillospiraceae bacterium]
MLEKPVNKILPIGYYIGAVLLALGAAQFIPVVTSLASGEWHVAFIFIFTASLIAGIGAVLMAVGKKYRSTTISWCEGMIVASSSWLIGMLLCALPYYLSGHYLSYLDACFDVMSGLTTTGVILIQDMDHLSNGINMWRFLLTFIGGQGMVVLALTFLTKNSSDTYKMYVGEAKDERIRPNATSTARSIWYISLLYLAIGSAVMFIAGLVAGLPTGKAFLHGVWIYMSAWSTGGFAPMSQNILYYHSAFYEIASMVFFIVGSFNFALHYAVLSGKKHEIRRNIETVTFSVTMTITTLLACLGLMRANVYPDIAALFRKGFYQLISGHTTTGFMSVYAKQFYTEWGEIALFAIIIAMLFGGSACSTAGGFKGLRTGIIFNTLKTEIKRMMLPESRVSEQKIHHIRDVVLSEAAVRSAFLIVFAYIVTFSIGTLAGMFAGFPFAMAAFESASVTGNVGLSIGITSATMPSFLKVVYIVIMWLARLEFMSVLALGAYIVGRVKSKCETH